MLVLEFVGNLGNDAEIKNFNGQNYIAFNVGVNDTYKDAQGNKVTRTTWVSCLKHGDGAVAQYLKRGKRVFVRGDLSVKTFSNANGVQVGVNCRVRELELLGGNEGSQPGATNNAPGATASAAPAQTAQQQAQQGAPFPSGTAAPKDDLPF